LGGSRTRRFENIIIKNTRNGIVQLREVGRAEIGAENYDTNLLYADTKRWCRRAALSNANALESIRRPRRNWSAFEVVSSRIKYVVAFDTTTVVGDSVREVDHA